MKPHFFLALLIFLSLSLPAFAQEAPLDSAAVKAEHARIEATFEKVIQKYVDFFQVKQKVLYKETNKKSDTGEACYLVEYTCQEINYGMSSTTNESASYNAHIILGVKTLTNRPCGKLSGAILLGASAGWPTVAEALANNRVNCFTSQVKSPTYKVRLNFDYVDGKWVFKDVKHVKTGKAEPVLSAVFGAPAAPSVEVTETEGINYNKKWLALVNN